MDKHSGQTDNSDESGIERSSETGFHLYELFTHPVLGREIIKVGFSWPAFLLGPIWLLPKRLWIHFVICAVAIFFVARALVPNPNDASEDENRDEFGKSLLVLMIYGVVGALGNEEWKDDLLRRGYTLSDSIKARSVDEVKAILATRGQQ